MDQMIKLSLNRTHDEIKKGFGKLNRHIKQGHIIKTKK
jgi:hypothetical protein